jgi:predicted nucleic acid-binding protein
MRVELCRLGTREGVLDLADAMLGPILLIPLDEEILTRAEVLPPTSVGTLDAIHLATALRVAEAGELDALMTYDKRLAEGARKHGITVLSPA